MKNHKGVILISNRETQSKNRKDIILKRASVSDWNDFFDEPDMPILASLPFYTVSSFSNSYLKLMPIQRFFK